MCTYLKIFDAFVSDLNKICARNSFLHCHNLNYLLRVSLIKSGFFDEEDIKLRWSFVRYISPHQYMSIAVGDKVIDVDLWGKAQGIEFGDYAHGFK